LFSGEAHNSRRLSRPRWAAGTLPKLVLRQVPRQVRCALPLLLLFSFSYPPTPPPPPTTQALPAWAVVAWALHQWNRASTTEVVIVKLAPSA
jgi:hypothetical protein